MNETTKNGLDPTSRPGSGVRVVFGGFSGKLMVFFVFLKLLGKPPKNDPHPTSRAGKPDGKWDRVIPGVSWKFLEVSWKFLEVSSGTVILGGFI